jgi:branched-chain amino acid transport system substrate-binding protein
MQGSLRFGMQRGRLVALTVIAVMLAVAVAVLLATTGATSRVDAAGKAPIVIASTCDCSGVSASSTGGWTSGMQVWVKWINSQGGILGHKVQLLTTDTKTDATANLTAVKGFLANKKVVALIPGAAAGAALAPTINAAKAPVVGGLGDDALWFTNKYVFPVSTTGNNLAIALAAIGAKGQKNKNAAELYCAEVAACLQTAPLFAAGVKKFGGKVVYKAAVSASSPDYTAQCLAAKAANPSYMWISDGTAIISRVAASCAKNGFKPRLVVPNYDSTLLNEPAMNGAYAAFGDALYNSKAASQFSAAVSKFNPSLKSSSKWGQYVFQAWLSGQELARAITLAAPKGNAVTRADVFTGLYKMHNETLGGAAPNLTFHKGKPANLSCTYTGQIKNKRLVGLPGVTC